MCVAQKKLNQYEHMLKRNSVATTLKFLCKSLYSVKSYDKTKMKVFALSLYEKFSWGLTF